MNMHVMLFFIFTGLLVVAALLQYKQWIFGGIVPADQYAFKCFQRDYLLVYTLAMFADWLQGPYGYALYQDYGFDSSDIGLLFVAGFGSSGLLGCFVGGIADAMGRKFTCIIFCIIYGLSCIIKHSQDFNMLFVGRILSGVATSMLCSVFDAWMVDEHHSRKFDSRWISQTFCLATFGSGVAAVIAGILAYGLASVFGSVAPFDASLITLIICGLTLNHLWNENYGTKYSKTKPRSGDDSRDRYRSFLVTMRDATVIIFTNANILLCGILQSCFEGAMYSFVLLWTPAFPPDINLGMVFACFMVSIMVGSCAFAELRSMGLSLASIIIGLCIVGSIVFCYSSVYVTKLSRLGAFISFEVTCGMYFPAFYTLRSQVVPDQSRATILNIFRVPLNIIIVAVCVTFGRISISHLLHLCAGLLLLAAMCGVVLHQKLIVADKPAEATGEAVSLRANEKSTNIAELFTEVPDKVIARPPAATLSPDGVVAHV